MLAFNVTDYGATGHKDQAAQHAIQTAIDGCAAAGGVHGEYTSSAQLCPYIHRDRSDHIFIQRCEYVR